MKSIHLGFIFLFELTVVLAPTKRPETFNFNFQQNDYKCRPEHIEVVSYDKTYVSHLRAATFKHNRTCTAFNVSVNYKVNFKDKMEVIVQAYKFASNEYRLFPIRFEINTCIIFNNNILGLAYFTKCGNLTGCPFLKNQNYHICNFVPDMSKLPPYIPTGKFMVESYGVYFSKEIWVARGYAEVYRPFV